MCSGRCCFILVLSVLVCVAAGSAGGFWNLFFEEDYDPPEPAVNFLSIFGSMAQVRQWDVFYVRESEKKGIGVLMIRKIPQKRGLYTVVNPSGMVKGSQQPVR